MGMTSVWRTSLRAILLLVALGTACTPRPVQQTVPASAVENRAVYPAVEWERLEKPEKNDQVFGWTR